MYPDSISMTLDYEDISKVTEQLVDISTRLPSNEAPERAGGYLTIGADGLHVMRSIPIGTVTIPDKLSAYREFSQEKAFRLQADWLRDHSIVSSWFTRNEAIRRFGGAVLLQDPEICPVGSHYILSFSGLKEHVDEAVALTLGTHLGLATDESVGRIVRESENPVFPEMLEAYMAMRS